MVRVASMLLVLPLALSGCYATKMYYASEVPSGAVRSARSHTFVFGMIPADPVNLESLCGEPGISELQIRLPPSGLLATGLTFGLWTPMEVTATCTARSH
jgi:hypothetical protein